jgi:hypothetical protein
MTTPSYGQSWYKIYGYAGKTSTWCVSDTQDQWDANMADPEKRAKLEEFGWTRDNVSYTFNKDGFRADEFTDGVNDSVLFLGCSLTMGIGMSLEKTWAYKVAHSLGLRRYNLGVGGGGSDMCFRLAYHWIPRLRPKYVVMLTPSAERMEIVMDTENLLYLPAVHNNKNSFYYNWLSHPANADMNRLKSVMGVQTICNSIGVPLVEIPVEECTVPRNNEPVESWERDILQPNPSRAFLARDLMHPGWTWNLRVEKMIMEKLSEFAI